MELELGKRWEKGDLTIVLYSHTFEAHKSPCTRFVVSITLNLYTCSSPIHEMKPSGFTPKAIGESNLAPYACRLPAPHLPISSKDVLKEGTEGLDW